MRVKNYKGQARAGLKAEAGVFPKCDHKGCEKDGTCPAPKDKSLREYFHFCPEHAAEYNKAWDYYEGMSAVQIEAHIRDDVGWGRPTWKLGAGASIKDTFGLFGGDIGEKKKHETRRSAKAEKAMGVLGLEEPLSLAKVKRKYRELAKKYHPDVTGGDKLSEDRFKEIARAYKVLMKEVEG